MCYLASLGFVYKNKQLLLFVLQRNGVYTKNSYYQTWIIQQTWWSDYMARVGITTTTD